MVNANIAAMAKKKVNGSDKARKKFVKDLLMFYEDSMSGVISSVKMLARLQKAHPKEYDVFKRLGRDPDQILFLLKDVDVEQKALLFEVLVRSNSLSQRLQTLNDLTVREKEILANDLKQFSKYITQELKEVS